jgi:hypothetical protein
MPGTAFALTWPFLKGHNLRLQTAHNGLNRGRSPPAPVPAPLRTPAHPRLFERRVLRHPLTTHTTLSTHIFRAHKKWDPVAFGAWKVSSMRTERCLSDPGHQRSVWWPFFQFFSALRCDFRAFFCSFCWCFKYFFIVSVCGKLDAELASARATAGTDTAWPRRTDRIQTMTGFTTRPSGTVPATIS